MPLIKGNQKLGDSVWQWSLPIEKSCRPTAWCKEHCYAKKGRFYFKNVQDSLEKRWKEHKEPNWSDNIIKQIHRVKAQMVRIHVAGDFYSKEYIEDWHKIVKACTNTRFRAFTKRVDMRDPLLRLAGEPNMILCESMDDSKEVRGIPEIPMGIIEGSKWQGPKDRICEGSCPECKFLCWNKDNTNIIFPAH